VTAEARRRTVLLIATLATFPRATAALSPLGVGQVALRLGGTTTQECVFDGEVTAKMEGRLRPARLRPWSDLTNR
jgi:hypothetical protein